MSTHLLYMCAAPLVQLSLQCRSQVGSSSILQPMMHARSTLSS